MHSRRPLELFTTILQVQAQKRYMAAGIVCGRRQRLAAARRPLKIAPANGLGLIGTSRTASFPGESTDLILLGAEDEDVVTGTLRETLKFERGHSSGIPTLGVVAELRANASRQAFLSLRLQFRQLSEPSSAACLQ
jgi:hypothetical protein